MDELNNNNELNNQTNNTSTNTTSNDILSKELLSKINHWEHNNNKDLERLQQELENMRSANNSMQQQVDLLNTYKLNKEREEKIAANTNKYQSYLLKGGLTLEQVQGLTKCANITDNMDDEHIEQQANTIIDSFKTLVQETIKKQMNLSTPPAAYNTNTSQEELDNVINSDSHVQGLALLRHIRTEKYK